MTSDASATEVQCSTPEPFEETPDICDANTETESEIQNFSNIQNEENPLSECSMNEKSIVCAGDPSSAPQNMPVITVQTLEGAVPNEGDSNELEVKEESIDSEESQQIISKSTSNNDIQDSEQVDHNIFLDNVGNNIVRGCVAPAPTPVPTMAPLAEDEIYSVDEDKCSVKDEEDSANELTERAVRSSSDVRTSDINAALEEAQCNTVCPWDDE